MASVQRVHEGWIARLLFAQFGGHVPFNLPPTPAYGGYNKLATNVVL